MRAALAALGLALVLASAPAAAMRPADFAFGLGVIALLAMAVGLYRDLQ